MSNTKTDWTVRVYHGDTTLAAQWEIENRTEREAEKEAMAEVERSHQGHCWSMTPREKLFSVCWSRRQCAQYIVRAENEEDARQRAGAMAESQNLHVTLRWELDCGGPEIRYIEEEK